jgi:hypothetical protein
MRRPGVSLQVSVSRRNHGAAGQSVVELAITLPILLLLMLGLVNLGILMHAQIVLTNAAWEGARAGATITDPSHGDEEIIGAVQRSLSGLDASRVAIEIDPEQDEPPRNQPGPMPRGQPLAVGLEYRLTMSLPVVVEVPVRARAVSRMEYRNP